MAAVSPNATFAPGAAEALLGAQRPVVGFQKAAIPQATVALVDVVLGADVSEAQFAGFEKASELLFPDVK